MAEYEAMLKKISEESSNLHKNEQIQIFRLVLKDTNKYVENYNGIYIQLSNLKHETIKIIYEYIIFCINQRIELNRNDETQEMIKQTLNNEINNSKQDNLETIVLMISLNDAENKIIDAIRKEITNLWTEGIPAISR